MAGRPADLIVSGYEALSRGDIEAWLDITTADVELHEVAEVPDARVYRGRGEAREWAEGMLQLVDEWRWVPEEVLVNEGNTVVIRAAITGRSKAGVPLDLTVFHVIRTEGNKVASFRGFFDREQAIEAAGLSA
jgi:ketosteroid isomerase-like protein